MADDIPGFERDPEIEELLDQDVLEMDEDTRSEVQLYKSRLLQAKRDAGMSTDKPPWSDGGGADQASDESDTAEESSPDDSGDTDEEEPVEDPDEPAEEEDVEETPSTDEEDTSEGEDAEVKDDIPGFDPDPEMEELLEKDIQDVDEDKRVEVQKYKSRKMKAKQEAKDADDSEEDSSGSTDSSEDETAESDTESSSEETDEEDIDFDEDPEMEELLEKDIMEVDEDKRAEVQKYKSRKMKAKQASRDGESEQDDAEETSDTESAESPEDESEDEKAAPPADDEKRHDGERKIKEIVESRTSGREVSRRGFLSSFGLGAAGFLGVLGLGGISTGRFFFPNVMSNPPEQFVAGEPSDYPTNTVSDQFKGQYRVWIVNLGDRIVAINAICTHLGCTPNWLSGQGIFKCPCHGSGYYMSGVNFEGPAPRPMDRVGIRLSPTGKIIVDKSMKFAQQASPGWEAKSAYVPV